MLDILCEVPTMQGVEEVVVNAEVVEGRAQQRPIYAEKEGGPGKRLGGSASGAESLHLALSRQ